ncbi:MAG: hypothetical protein RL141_493 [Candidatus Parcubacteria bacterium]
MPSIPASVNTAPIEGLQRLYQGKVRDTYELPDHPGYLLVVASDRLSIFDFVLPAAVPQKGSVLTALNHFWRTQVIKDAFPHDFVAAGAEIDEYLPEALHGDASLQARATVVEKLTMLPVEAIARGYLTGSGWNQYGNDQRICGQYLPSGLLDGSALPYPLFTPTTKAEEGHDEAISADSVVEEFGIGIERNTLGLYTLAATFAASRGIILADTKLEFGRTNDGVLCLGDEVFTPDSSRFWDLGEWQKVRGGGKSPNPFDKQLVRNWGKEIGIHRLDPKIPEDVAWVHGQTVPEDLLARTTRLYRYIFWRLTGNKLEDYQQEEMDINTNPLPVRIEVISGSRSDEDQMGKGLSDLRRHVQEGRAADVHRHVISCYQNPDTLAQYARNVPDNAIIIAGAGLVAALPGMLKALLVAAGKGHIPVLGVAFEGSTPEETLAAELSIKCLPGNLVLKDIDGKVYVGPAGFRAACNAAVEDEFLRIAPPPGKAAMLHPSSYC